MTNLFPNPTTREPPAGREHVERTNVQAHTSIGAQVASAALRDLCRSVYETEAALAHRLGLSAGEYRAVKLVLYARDPLGVTGLATHLGYSKGTTSELLARLEARGFVWRVPDATDARRVIIRATDYAFAQVHETLGMMFQAMAEVARAHDDVTLRAVTCFLRDATSAVRA